MQVSLFRGERATMFEHGVNEARTLGLAIAGALVLAPATAHADQTQGQGGNPEFPAHGTSSWPGKRRIASIASAAHEFRALSIRGSLLGHTQP